VNRGTVIQRKNRYARVTRARCFKTVGRQIPSRRINTWRHVNIKAAAEPRADIQTPQCGNLDCITVASNIGWDRNPNTVSSEIRQRISCLSAGPVSLRVSVYIIGTETSGIRLNSTNRHTIDEEGSAGSDSLNLMNKKEGCGQDCGDCQDFDDSVFSHW